MLIHSLHRLAYNLSALPDTMTIEFCIPKSDCLLHQLFVVPLTHIV